MKPTLETERFSLWRGDCLRILPELDDGCADLITGDPPYGIDYQSARRTDKSEWKPKIANDKLPFVWWLHSAFRVCRDGGGLVCFCRWDVQEAFRLAIEWSGFDVKSQVIWDRDWHGMGDLNGSFGPQHDVIWFATKGDLKFPGKRPLSVLRHLRVPADDLVHPNEKPVALMRDLSVSLCPKGGLIVDPFMGSGVGGQGALSVGRRYFGMEMDPEHFSKAAKRIADSDEPGMFAGNQSTLFPVTL